MKKNVYLSLMMICLGPIAFAQITNIEPDTILASDTFEDDEAWLNYDQEGAPIALNNELGGEYTYNWTAWGGVAVNDGNSAEGGTKCLQAHWGGIANLQYFVIDPNEIYQLEMLVHPNSGNDGTWNNWAAIHLFTFDNTDVWQSQGFRIRFMNGGEGGNPNNLAVDYWQSEAGDYKIDFVYDWSDDPTSAYIAGAVSPDFWIPVKLVFTGEGTVESPILIDYYINDNLVKSSSYDSIHYKGDGMIGISNNGNDGDVARFDNIVLTKMKESTSTGLNSTINENSHVAVYPNPATSSVRLNISGDFADLNYKLYDITGRLLETKTLRDKEELIPVDHLNNSLYFLEVYSGKDKIGANKILKK